MVSIKKLPNATPKAYAPGDACPRCQGMLAQASGELINMKSVGRIAYCMRCRQGYPLKS